MPLLPVVGHPSDRTDSLSAAYRNSRGQYRKQLTDYSGQPHWPRPQEQMVFHWLEADN